VAEHIRLIGAVIGLAGGQILTFILFGFFAEPCECGFGDTSCLGTQCVAGRTFGEFWVTYGAGLTAFATVLGFVIAAVMSDKK
jgi:hypothetical protein